MSTNETDTLFWQKLKFTNDSNYYIIIKSCKTYYVTKKEIASERSFVYDSYDSPDKAVHRLFQYAKHYNWRRIR